MTSDDRHVSNILGFEFHLAIENNLRPSTTTILPQREARCPRLMTRDANYSSPTGGAAMATDETTPPQQEACDMGVAPGCFMKAPFLDPRIIHSAQ